MNTVVCRIHTNDGGIETTCEEGTSIVQKTCRERKCPVCNSDSSVLVVIEYKMLTQCGALT